MIYDLVPGADSHRLFALQILLNFISIDCNIESVGEQMKHHFPVALRHSHSNNNNNLKLY